MTRRVVITGYGLVSCLRSDVETLWNNIKFSKSRIKKVEFEVMKVLVFKCGYVVGFFQENYFDKRVKKV